MLLDQSQTQSPSTGAMDMTPLENLREKIFHADPEAEVGYEGVLDEYLGKPDEKSIVKSPLHKLINDLTAISKLLTAQRKMGVEEVETTGVDSNSSSQVGIDLIQFMRQLVSHND